MSAGVVSIGNYVTAPLRILPDYDLVLVCGWHNGSIGAISSWGEEENVKPGWYDDGSGTYRWWDGTQWTEHVWSNADASAHTIVYPDDVSPASAGTQAGGGIPVQQQPSLYQPIPRRRGLPVGVVIGIVAGTVVVAVAVVAMIVAVLGPATPQIAVATNSSSTASSPAQPSSSPPSTSTSSPGAVVVSYSTAWEQADCALLKKAVTTMFFETTYKTCAIFVDSAQSFLQNSSGEYLVHVDSVDVSGMTASVQTTETYTYEGESHVTQGSYDLIEMGGVWKITDLNFTDQSGSTSSDTPGGIA